MHVQSLVGRCRTLVRDGSGRARRCRDRAEDERQQRELLHEFHLEVDGAHLVLSNPRFRCRGVL